MNLHHRSFSTAASLVSTPVRDIYATACGNDMFYASMQHVSLVSTIYICEYTRSLRLNSCIDILASLFTPVSRRGSPRTSALPSFGLRCVPCSLNDFLSARFHPTNFPWLWAHTSPRTTPWPVGVWTPVCLSRPVSRRIFLQ